MEILIEDFGLVCWVGYWGGVMDDGPRDTVNFGQFAQVVEQLFQVVKELGYMVLLV